MAVVTEALSANYNESWAGARRFSKQPGPTVTQPITFPRPARPLQISLGSQPAPTAVLDTDTVIKIIDTYTTVRAAVDATRGNPPDKLRADFDIAVSLLSDLLCEYENLSSDARSLVDQFTRALHELDRV
ncbi:hypothetical protein NMY22_g20072 [Coprinellus aureogranulatus]|nr:hypothetical protein NMY22_g20072 [Coprinellus aureogranulatus]